MARSMVQWSSGNALVITNGATTYIGILSGCSFSPGSEALAQHNFRYPGKLTNLFVRSVTNTASGASTVKTRINGADGNLTVSIPATTTGKFEDTSNSDTIALNDLVCYQFVNGGGANNTWAGVSVSFLPTDSTVTVQMMGVGVTFPVIVFSTPSATVFGRVTGEGGNSATETNAEITWNQTFTAQYGFARVTTNGRASASTLTSRKNQADGNIVISITGSTTGLFEDTTHTDSIVSGDETDWKFQTGTGTGNISIQNWGYYAIATDSKFPMTAGASPASPLVVNQATTGYWGTSSGSSVTTTEARVQFEPGFNLTLSNLRANVTANTLLATSTIRTRKATANGNQALSITTLATGYFEDTTNTDVVGIDDAIDYQIVAGAGGTSFTIQYVGCVATASHFTQTLTETVTLTEAFTKTLSRTLAEAMTLTENFLQVATSNKILTETLTLTENRVKALSRTISETLTHTEALSVIGGIFRLFTETVNLSDTILRTPAKVLTETLTHTETLIRALSRRLTEAMTLTESFLQAATSNKILTELLTLTENAPQKSISRLIVDSLALVEAAVLFSGVWIKRVKPVTGWSDRTEPLVSWSNRTKPTSIWVDRTKPTSPWSDRTPPTTNWS